MDAKVRLHLEIAKNGQVKSTVFVYGPEAGSQICMANLRRRISGDIQAYPEKWRQKSEGGKSNGNR